VEFGLSLDEARARDPQVTGSKAASLAVARAGGIPVLPGFAITTAAHAEFIAAGHALPRHVGGRVSAQHVVATLRGRIVAVDHTPVCIGDQRPYL
jgi:phosphoenolpyruvate synthase/pyruvate phosphate dikinase